jgi:hypothetical protein
MCAAYQHDKAIPAPSLRPINPKRVSMEGWRISLRRHMLFKRNFNHYSMSIYYIFDRRSHMLPEKGVSSVCGTTRAMIMKDECVAFVVRRMEHQVEECMPKHAN